MWVHVYWWSSFITAIALLSMAAQVAWLLNTRPTFPFSALARYHVAFWTITGLSVVLSLWKPNPIVGEWIAIGRAIAALTCTGLSVAHWLNRERLVTYPTPEEVTAYLKPALESACLTEAQSIGLKTLDRIAHEFGSNYAGVAGSEGPR